MESHPDSDGEGKGDPFLSPNRMNKLHPFINAHLTSVPARLCKGQAHVGSPKGVHTTNISQQKR